MIKFAITAVKEISKHQVTRFLVVGILSFVIEFCIFSFLIDFLHIEYIHANLPAMAAAIFCNYYLTKKLVFESGRYSEKRTFILFLTFTFGGIFLNQIVLWIMVEEINLNVKISKTFAVGLVAVFNYLTKKYFVF